DCAGCGHDGPGVSQGFRQAQAQRFVRVHAELRHGLVAPRPIQRDGFGLFLTRFQHHPRAARFPSRAFQLREHPPSESPSAHGGHDVQPLHLRVPGRQRRLGVIVRSPPTAHRGRPFGVAHEEDPPGRCELDRIDRGDVRVAVTGDVLLRHRIDELDRVGMVERHRAKLHGPSERVQFQCCQRVSLSYGLPSTATHPSGSPTDPLTDLPSRKAVDGGSVATSAWSSPPVSTQCSGSAPSAVLTSTKRSATVSLSVCTSIPTPEASAMCPRSASSPSETSIIAVAPANAAAGPAAYGGSGQRWAFTTLTGERNPLPNTASPAAAQPSRPHMATMSPGRAPERVTGARPPRSPSAVTLTTISSARTMSPPTTPTSACFASAATPSSNSVATAAGVSAGQANVTTTDIGTAPIAAMSARLTATAFRPTCVGVDQSSLKCTPSTRASVATTTRPSGAATAAASSPGPNSVVDGCGRSPVACRISPNSPISATVSAPDAGLSPTPNLRLSRDRATTRHQIVGYPNVAGLRYVAGYIP